MPEWIWHWSGYAVALVSFVGVVWALVWDRPRGRKRCRRCWYDLGGVGDLPASCPECGKAHAKAKDLTRTRRRWGRAVVLGLVMVVGGYGLWVVPRVASDGPPGLLPTTLMVAIAPLISHENDVPVGAIHGSPALWYWGQRWDRLPDWAKSVGVEYWYLTGWRRSQGAPSQTEASAVDAVLAHEVWFGRLSRERAADWATWAFSVEAVGLAGSDWEYLNQFPQSGMSLSGEIRFVFLSDDDDPLSFDESRMLTYRPDRRILGRPFMPHTDQPRRIRILYRLFDDQGEYCRLVVVYRPASGRGFMFEPERVERLPIAP